MAVIAFPNISPRTESGRAAMELKLTSLTAAFRGTLGASLKTLERPGAFWGARIPYENLYEADRAKLEATAAACRGQASRFYLPDFSRLTPRGSFPATELLTNNFFASGTTGWTGDSQLAISAADGVLRITRQAVTGAGGVTSTAVSVTPYAPYVFRGITLAGRGYSAGVRIIESSLGGATSFAPGRLHTQAFVSSASSYALAIRDENTSGLIAGDYFSVCYTSVSRCILVDNGPNALVRSDEFPTTWAPTRATVSSNVGATPAPDGTLTADSINEDGTASNSHYVTQSVTVPAAVDDFSFACSLKAGTRTWVCLEISEATGGHTLRAFVNLSTGALGTVAVSGANWLNPRAIVVDQGSGWYRLHVTGRKASAATSLTAAVLIAEADNDLVFNGLTAASIYAWRASLAATSVPIRGTQTVASASTGTSQTGGALYLKGLPASTSGLLLMGDLIEITTSVGSELKRVTASLNSDAAGLGYLQFEPPIRNSPADNAAVIVCRPMMRALLDSNSVGWTEHSGGFADLAFSCVEDVAA
jgi:hypothetical protein